MNKENNKENNNEGAKIYFGKYKQDKKIGEGSFGKIYIGISLLYLAININTNEKFAIKLVRLFLFRKVNQDKIF
jgi:hypothetical protein